MDAVAAARVRTMKQSALIETYEQFPLEITHASGSRLFARDGRTYWDFYGGHAVALLGHSHPAVASAIAEQASRLAFYSNALPIEIRDRAADRLCAFAGAGLERVFFCNSGAEANENALKLALQQTGRRRIAAIEGGWHGRTLLCLSATTDAKLTNPLDGLLIDSVRLRANTLEDVSKIDASCAAVIVEPIASIAGIIEMQPAFLAALRKRCDEVGAYLIYDEIQTGVGRLGRPYVAGAHGTHPDLATSAKSLANGLPIGALLMNAKVAAKVKRGDLGSTFGGGPIVCAALLAVLDTIEREDLLMQATRLGEALHRLAGVGPVRGVRGRGGLIGLELACPAKTLQHALLESGFVTGTSAIPNVMRLMPPINMPLAAVDEFAAALQRLTGLAEGSAK